MFGCQGQCFVCVCAYAAIIASVGVLKNVYQLSVCGQLVLRRDDLTSGVNPKF